jgi:hypothetical protein
LSNDDVIQKISANFVPVAVSLQKIRTDPTIKDWFRAVGKQKDQYQGVWIVSPADKVLGGGDFEYKDAPKVLATMDAALKAFGPVQPRNAKRQEPLPFRGVGVRPEGNVDLALYRCYLHLGKPDGPHLRDTLPLKKDEWSAFAPPKLVAGTEWTIPADVAKKLVRPFCLNTLGGDMPGPEDAKLAQLTAKVESLKDGRAQIRLTGAFEAVKLFKEQNLSFRSTATAAGIAEYDLEEKALSSFLLVFQGAYQQGAQPETKTARTFGAVAEWHRKQTSPP